MFPVPNVWRDVKLRQILRNTHQIRVSDPHALVPIGPSHERCMEDVSFRSVEKAFHELVRYRFDKDAMPPQVPLQISSVRKREAVICTHLEERTPEETKSLQYCLVE